MNEMKNQKIILLAAHPRSGSTWIGNLLDSNPAVTYRHEPLARLSKKIGRGPLDSLKFDYGLSPGLFDDVLSVVKSAYTDVDRPPFFVKNGSKISPQIQALLWMISSRFPALGAFYRSVVERLVVCQDVLVLKETGWCSHLPSIVAGLKPYAVLLLLRHPCGYVNSILNGIRQNLMHTPYAKVRTSWYRSHSSQPAIKALGLVERDVIGLDLIEYLALQWRVFVDLCLAIDQTDCFKSKVIIYENIQANPMVEMEHIFSIIGLEHTSSTKKFVMQSTSSSLKEMSVLKRDGGSEYYSVYRDGNVDVRDWEKKLSGDQIRSIVNIAGLDNVRRFWPLN